MLHSFHHFRQCSLQLRERRLLAQQGVSRVEVPKELPGRIVDFLKQPGTQEELQALIEEVKASQDKGSILDAVRTSLQSIRGERERRLIAENLQNLEARIDVHFENVLERETVKSVARSLRENVLQGEYPSPRPEIASPQGREKSARGKEGKEQPTIGQRVKEVMGGAWNWTKEQLDVSKWSPTKKAVVALTGVAGIGVLGYWLYRKLTGKSEKSEKKEGGFPKWLLWIPGIGLAAWAVHSVMKRFDWYNKKLEEFGKTLAAGLTVGKEVAEKSMDVGTAAVEGGLEGASRVASLYQESFGKSPDDIKPEDYPNEEEYYDALFWSHLKQDGSLWIVGGVLYLGKAGKFLMWDQTGKLLDRAWRVCTGEDKWGETLELAKVYTEGAIIYGASFAAIDAALWTTVLGPKGGLKMALKSTALWPVEIYRKGFMVVGYLMPGPKNSVRILSTQVIVKSPGYLRNRLRIRDWNPLGKWTSEYAEGLFEEWRAWDKLARKLERYGGDFQRISFHRQRVLLDKLVRGLNDLGPRNEIPHFVENIGGEDGERLIRQMKAGQLNDEHLAVRLRETYTSAEVSAEVVEATSPSQVRRGPRLHEPAEEVPDAARARRPAASAAEMPARTESSPVSRPAAEVPESRPDLHLITQEGETVDPFATRRAGTAEVTADVIEQAGRGAQSASEVVEDASRAGSKFLGAPEAWSQSGRVAKGLYIAGAAAEGVNLGFDIYALYGQLERNDTVLNMLVKDLKKAGFLYEPRTGHFRHPAGPEIELTTLEKSISSQQNPQWVRIGVDTAGLLTTAVASIALGPVGIIVGGVLVTVHAGITAWEQGKMRNLLRHTPTPVLAAIGVAKLAGTSEYETIAQVSSGMVSDLLSSQPNESEVEKRLIRRKMFALLFFQELSRSTGLPAGVLEGRDMTEFLSDDGEFFREGGDYDRIIGPYLAARLFERANDDGVRWQDFREGKIDQGWFDLVNVSEANMRLSLREAATFYAQHLCEKHYVELQLACAEGNVRACTERDALQGKKVWGVPLQELSHAEDGKTAVERLIGRMTAKLDAISERETRTVLRSRATGSTPASTYVMYEETVYPTRRKMGGGIFLLQLPKEVFPEMRRRDQPLAAIAREVMLPLEDGVKITRMNARIHRTDPSEKVELRHAIASELLREIRHAVDLLRERIESFDYPGWFDGRERSIARYAAHVALYRALSREAGKIRKAEGRMSSQEYRAAVQRISNDLADDPLVFLTMAKRSKLAVPPDMDRPDILTVEWFIQHDYADALRFDWSVQRGNGGTPSAETKKAA